jgi:hypothetical protein
VLSEHDIPIAPSTYYAYRDRGFGPTEADLADAYAAHQLFQLWRKNRRLYGRRKLWKTARRKGLILGRDQVERLMKIAGITGIRRGKRCTVTTRRNDRAPRPGRHRQPSRQPHRINPLVSTQRLLQPRPEPVPDLAAWTITAQHAPAGSALVDCRRDAQDSSHIRRQLMTHGPHAATSEPCLPDHASPAGSARLTPTRVSASLGRYQSRAREGSHSVCRDQRRQLIGLLEDRMRADLHLTG